MSDGEAGTLNDDWSAPDAGADDAADAGFESPGGGATRARRASSAKSGSGGNRTRASSAGERDMSEGADATLERRPDARTPRKTTARSQLPRASRSAASDYRVSEQPAFVLHSYPYRETSLIIDVLSRDHGRVALVAKGAKRPHSALRGVLQTFQPLTLNWTGKGEVRTLTGAEWVGGMLPLAGDALLCGFYVNELLVKFLAREDPHPGLFNHYVVTLTRLAHDLPAVQVLRSFERVLLRDTGYALALNRTVNRRTVVAEGRYVFDPERGVREASAEWPAQWPVLSGQTLLDMEEDDYHRPQTVAQSKALMRFLLNTYLGGTPLATRQILIDLQNL
ncbi:DNA repair protein RecO (recombination protein O) [Paraburkholderia bannensis]|uniref:DNA repair protein RecO n=2 Tax=Burkholderiaceae TaxID=119060 RepID=A0A7W9TU78_9BURK|nr:MULTISPECIES: DNA repair protein RecO [Paraburkholderia]MBB3255689.1 DNA repair protein RecO (recombination protein O) [Paraburkholderia sp. WP4_3_2]MBB6100300.1 DNA repair protein RecO (recombination protein O) [Paraburkholderia bannensis]